MRRPAILVSILAAVGASLGGCAWKHRAPDVTLPAQYEAVAGVATLSPAELDQWWLRFNDPELNALENEAFRRAPDARTAEARVLEARATRNSQTAQTLPTGNIVGNASHQRAYNIGPPVDSLFPIGGTTISETANLDVSWELDLFGRLATARKVANADLAATRFNIEGARASLAASVADSYFQARGLAIQLADAHESVRIESRLQDVAQRKANIGIGAASDADRVAGDLAQARAQVEDLEAQLHVAQRQLLILVGRGVAPTASLAVAPSADDPPPIPAAVPGELLVRRPDVREAEARLRSQVGTARLRHLAVFPTFTLLPGLGASRTVQPSVGFIPPATLIPQQQTTELGMWTLGGSVTVPTLEIPRLIYDAKAEDARTEQAVIAYEKAVQTAYGDAETAFINLAASDRAVTVLTDGEARAHRASEAAGRRFAMGLDDITSALSAEQAWRTTRSALTSQRVLALRRTVQTYKALGGGWAFTALPVKTPRAKTPEAKTP